MKNIAIVGADRRLYRKIARALGGEAVCELMPSGGRFMPTMLQKDVTPTGGLV